ncbi:Type IV secretion system protein virB1 [Hydrogenophaga sp. T4]|nr:Type IV secretion system protein virB1 [Hydrogenophaga sp. T4]
MATALALQAAGRNFSVGLGQINMGNFQRLGMSLESAFEPCSNLAAMQTVLSECFERARRKSPSRSGDQVALRAALSCYYSGNFSTGFRHGYVRKVVAAARNPLPISQLNPVKEPS